LKNQSKKDAFAKMQMLHIMKRCLNDPVKEAVIHRSIEHVARNYIDAEYDDSKEYHDWRREIWKLDNAR